MTVNTALAVPCVIEGPYAVRVALDMRAVTLAVASGLNGSPAGLDTVCRSGGAVDLPAWSRNRIRGARQRVLTRLRSL